MMIRAVAGRFSPLFVPAQRPLAKNITPLTSLRFFAAIWVVFLHYSKDAPFDVNNVTYFVYNGTSAVDLFFILSGFILAHCYLNAIVEERFAYGRYLWRRFARIYPLHLVTFLPFFVLMLAAGAGFVTLTHPEAYVWDAVLPNLLLLHAWGTIDGVSFNYPSWSVSAEWFAYLLLPAFAWLALRLRPLVGVGVAIVLLLVAALIANEFLTREVAELTYDFGILRIVPSFLLGIVTYRLSQAYDVAPSLAWILLATLLLLLGLLLHALPTPLIAMPLMALLIFTLASLHRQDRSRSLDRPTLVYLGEISYAIYMTHAMIDVFYFNAMHMLWPDKGMVGGLAVWLGGLALTIPLAALAYHLIENPARRWLTGGRWHRRAIRRDVPGTA